jgi:hypothetical protein
MNSQVVSAGTDEDILTFDVPDDALEQAASAERQAVLVRLQLATVARSRPSSGNFAIFAAIRAPHRASKAWLLTGVLARPRNKLTQAAARCGRAS